MRWAVQTGWLIAVASLVARSFSADPAPPPGAPQAAKPLDPVATATHIAATGAAMIKGDPPAAAQRPESVTHSNLRTARMPAAARPIDPEAALAAVMPLPGVRAAAWLDATQLMVTVEGEEHRSVAMIDQVCLAIDPLVDTLAVVVNLQGVTATRLDNASALSRNCQLTQGQRPLAKGKKNVGE